MNSRECYLALAISTIVILALVMLFSPNFCSVALSDSFDDAFEALDKSFDDSATKMDKESDKQLAAFERAWDEQERKINEEWERMREAVEQKWDTFLDSSKKVWVDYNAKTHETRSSVDFEQGKIIVETVVPIEEPLDEKSKEEQGKEEMPAASHEKREKSNVEIIKEAEPKIEQQVVKIFKKDEKTKEGILSDQIKDKQGNIVDDENLGKFIKDEILPQAKIEGEPFQSKDGVERVKVKIEVPMISDHLRVRAEKYQDSVKKYAKEYNLEPPFIFAVIETESYFNPKAKSHAGAYGLMQLIPRFGAREAYQYLYNKDTIISPDQLYIPGVNICLGGAYLKLLKDRYYKNIADKEKKRYLSIASYNWGPTAVRKKIITRCDIDKMSQKELFDYIRNNSPDETSDYLKRVCERIPKYQFMKP